MDFLLSDLHASSLAASPEQIGGAVLERFKPHTAGPSVPGEFAFAIKAPCDVSRVVPIISSTHCNHDAVRQFDSGRIRICQIKSRRWRIFAFSFTATVR